MPTNLQRLGTVVDQLLAYRGWTSAKKLDESYRPEAAPVGYGTIYRIIHADPAAKVDEGHKLLRLAAMLRLPPTALQLVYKGDTAGIERLVFPGDDGEAVRQFILDLMIQRSTENRSGKRRANR